MYDAALNAVSLIRVVAVELRSHASAHFQALNGRCDTFAQRSACHHVTGDWLEHDAMGAFVGHAQVARVALWRSLRLLHLVLQLLLARLQIVISVGRWTVR